MANKSLNCRNCGSPDRVNLRCSNHILVHMFDFNNSYDPRAVEVIRSLEAENRELYAAWAEMQTCDDIKLDQPLANCISELQKARETAEAALTQAQQALRRSNRMLATIADFYRVMGYCELQEIETLIKSNEAALPSDTPGAQAQEAKQ
jgi:hypothetical protein